MSAMVVVLEGFAFSSLLLFALSSVCKSMLSLLFSLFFSGKKRIVSSFSYIGGLGKDIKSEAFFHLLIVLGFFRWLIGRCFSLSFFPPKTIIKYWKLPFWRSFGAFATIKSYFWLIILNSIAHALIE